MTAKLTSASSEGDDHVAAGDLRIMPIAAWIGSLLCALAISPTLDDWWASTPLVDVDSSAFLPGVFWRPFETVLRVMMGAWPDAYPAGLHLAVMVGHGLAAALIWRCVRYLQGSALVASWIATLFILSPAVMMAAWSLDSANQTWSTACGLGALWARMKAPDKVLGPWLIWCVVALFWKESGAAWFIAAPLMATGLLVLARKREALELRSAGLSIVLGLSLLALYFIVRKALAIDGAVTADEGRYALNLSLVTTIKHVVMLLGVAWSTVETSALFSAMDRNLPMALTCGALGVPLLIVALWQGRKHLVAPAFIVSAIGAGALMGPHAIFGRVSEMHAHPLLAATLIMFSLMVVPALFTRPMARVALGLWFVGALTATGHKYMTWLETCRGAVAVQAALAEQWEGEPVHKVCSVARRDRPSGYATFSAGDYEAAGKGRALMAAWGWAPEFETRLVYSRERCPAPWTEAIVSVDAEAAPRIERVSSARRSR